MHNNKTVFLRATVLALLGGLVATSAAQGVITITGSGETRTLTAPASGSQNLGVTFLFQGDDLSLSDLTINHSTALDGSHDQNWLQNVDGGYQAKITLQNLGFSADIAGAPAQADPSGALQSLMNAVAAQGYSSIPNGSTLRFSHALNIMGLPIMQKSTLQLTDSYTLQDAALGLGSSSSATGILRGKAAPTPAPASKPLPKLPAAAPSQPIPSKPATIKPAPRGCQQGI